MFFTLIYSFFLFFFFFFFFNDTATTEIYTLSLHDALPIFFCMAWKDVSWSAWMDPLRRPVSCCGKKPLGTIVYRNTVATIVARVTSSVTGWWASTQCSAR